MHLAYHEMQGHTHNYHDLDREEALAAEQDKHFKSVSTKIQTERGLLNCTAANARLMRKLSLVN
jgi:hypothetical protein